MLAGAVGGIFGSPADIVNIRMQNDGKLPEASRRHYKNALGTCRASRPRRAPNTIGST